MSKLFLVSCFLLFSTLTFWSIYAIIIASTLNDTFHPYLVIQNALYILALGLPLSFCLTKRDLSEQLFIRLLSIPWFLLSACICFYHGYSLLTNIVYDAAFPSIHLASPGNWKPLSIVYVVMLFYGALYACIELIIHVIAFAPWTSSVKPRQIKQKRTPWIDRLLQFVQWIALLLPIVLVINSFVFSHTRLWQDIDAPHLLLVACIGLSFYVSAQRSLVVSILHLLVFTIALSTSIIFLFHEITNVAILTTWLDRTSYVNLFNSTESIPIHDKYTFMVSSLAERDEFATGTYVQHLLNVLLVSISTSLYVTHFIYTLRLCFN